MAGIPRAGAVAFSARQDSLRPQTRPGVDDPRGCAKAGRPAQGKEPEGGSSFEDLVQVCAATTVPIPREKPDSILDTVSEERLRLQYEGEIAYLRGNFRHTMHKLYLHAGI